MYELSRQLYRELRKGLIADRHAPGRSERVLLAACEQTVARLARDLHRFPRPARHLFTQVRFLYPLQDQLRVYGIIERQMLGVLRRLEDDARAEPGRTSALRCASINRRGRPCGREPMRGSRFCASHRHLESLIPQPHRGLSVA